MFVYLSLSLLNHRQITFIYRLASYLWKYAFGIFMFAVVLCQVHLMKFNTYFSLYEFRLYLRKVAFLGPER